MGYGIKILSGHMKDSTLRIVYHANFETILRYEIIFWGRNDKIQSVFVVQKKILRSICEIKFKESCRGKFERMCLSTAYGLYIFECLIFVFKNKGIFHVCGDHRYNTRTFILSIDELL